MRAQVAATQEVTREEGRQRVVEELSDPVYGEQEPSLLDRIIAWIDNLLQEFLRVSSDVVGGPWWLALLLVILVGLLLWLVLYLRPSRRRAVDAPVHEGQAMSADDHRASAQRHEAAGEYAESVTERLRAISVDLEERALITPRAGRTATELAVEAARVLPEEADGLDEGARIFNDVAYGDRAATSQSARILRELDARLRSARVPETGAENR